MKKCYIAGKISGLPILEYTSNFKEAEAGVLNLGYYPVNPVELNHDHDKTWLSYMREDLTELLKCNAVYVLRNWSESQGAKIEVDLAKSLGLIIYFQPCL